MSIIHRITAGLPQKNRLLEPFVGSGAVFLNTNYDEYLLNDINSDLINLYKIIKREGLQFIDYAASFFGKNNNNEKKYYQWREYFNECDNKVERAALFIYFNRHGYNGLCRYNLSGGFNVPFGRYNNPQFPRHALIEFSHKAQKAKFYCQDFEHFLKKSREHDVIYCDPPYVPLSKTANFDSYSKQAFTLDDQTRLANVAQQLCSENRQVLISNHDTQLTRELYQDAKLKHFPVMRRISCKANNRKAVKELLALYETD